jgi:hypothetical protein
MPRATKNLFRQSAFTQTTLLVRTSISVCVDVVINVDDQNLLATHLDTHHLTTPQIFYFGNLLKTHRG